MFVAGGTVRSITASKVKAGNQFLICFGNVNGDDQTVAQIPFDAVECITHESVTLASEDTARH